MVICHVYETLRTLHIWKLESIRRSKMPQHLPLPFNPRWFEHLPPTLLLHWPSLHCCTARDFSVLVGDFSKMWLFSSTVSMLLMTFPPAFTQPSLSMAITWNSSSHLQNLFIQSLPCLATTSSPWGVCSYLHNCSLTASEPPVRWLIYTLAFHQFSLVCTSFNFESWVSSQALMLSTSSPPCPFVIVMGQNNSAYYAFPSGCQENPEKKYADCNSWLLSSTGLNTAWMSTTFL